MVARSTCDSVEAVPTEGFIVGATKGSWCDIFPLQAGAKVTVGRTDGNDVVVEDDRASRNHCEFRKLSDGWYVVDLDSANGTWVNGTRIDRLHRLRPGDRIRVATRKLIYAATLVGPGEIVPDASRCQSTTL